jgi:hypothetical protein
LHPLAKPPFTELWINLKEGNRDSSEWIVLSSDLLSTMMTSVRILLPVKELRASSDFVNLSQPRKLTVIIDMSVIVRMFKVQGSRFKVQI